MICSSDTFSALKTINCLQPSEETTCHPELSDDILYIYFVT